MKRDGNLIEKGDVRKQMEEQIALAHERLDKPVG